MEARPSGKPSPHAMPRAGEILSTFLFSSLLLLNNGSSSATNAWCIFAEGLALAPYGVMYLTEWQCGTAEDQKESGNTETQYHSGTVETTAILICTAIATQRQSRVRRAAANT